MVIPPIKWLKRIAIALGVVVAAVALLWAVWWLWSQLAPQWDPRTITAILFVAMALLAATWWLWWRLPKRQIARLALTIRDPKARADTEDNFRKTVGQVLGGAAVLIGAAVAYLQFTQQQQAARDLLISNQVSKGFEQLAGDKISMRLGGIYALEGVMNTSEQYYKPVFEALCAFVRDSTTRRRITLATLPEVFFTVPEDGTANTFDKIPNDIQAALTVIGRRQPGTEAGADLAGANISNVYLNGANLRHSLLKLAHLKNAHLSEAHLEYSDLSDAHLEGAKLNKAYLGRIVLSGAYLEGTELYGAHLEGAALYEAHLEGANLAYSNLAGAVLAKAHLERANLSGARLDGLDPDGEHVEGIYLGGAHLEGADLTGVDLSHAENLTQKQLDQACGTPLALPPDLRLDQPKPCSDDLPKPPNLP